MAKTYDTYKDSGIAWIGEIPGEWEVVRIKNKYSFQTGATPPTGNENYFDGDNIWVSIADMKEKVIADSKKKISNKGIEVCSMSIVPKGSLLYSFKLSVGNVAFAGDNLYTNEAIASFSPNTGYLPFLYYTAQLFIVFNSNTNIYGANILNQELIKNAFVPYPPLSVQQSISSFLDTKCGEIDSLISIQEEMISELLAYKQSVITEAVTKGLDKKAKMKNSGVEWIGDIPEEWVKDKIFRVFSVIGSGTTPKATDDRNFEGDINWIQSGDINGGKMFECKNKISENVLNQYSTLKIYKAPFIIVAMYGASVGNISISNIDGCVNQACCVMSNSNQCFNYLFYAIKAAKDYLIYRAEGGGQPNISQDKLKNLWLPLPPLPVQQAIATYLDEKTSQIDSLIALKQSKIESLKEYKKSIIYEYVTGKKRV